MTPCPAATIRAPAGTQLEVIPSDGELLEAFARDRSERAFLAIYDRHAPAMYALACRLMGARGADAADVLQEAWLRVMPRLPQFRGESSLRTWLCGFVVNCSRERFREPLFDPVAERAARSAPAELRVDLDAALADLAPGARTVVILHDIHGYTHREIAAALKIDEGTSKSQLSRGRAALRARLHPEALKARQ